MQLRRRETLLVISITVMLSASRAPTAVAQANRQIVAPLKKIPSEQWYQIISGDPTKPGVPFVLRIDNDAGFVALPHTHPVDENIVVVQGIWAVAMGARFDRAPLQALAIGDYTILPAKMAHFGWAKTEVTIQVHGIGPFAMNEVDPLYELTDKGTALVAANGQPAGAPVTPERPCFQLKIGDRVRGALGTGTIVGGNCSPANNFTEYWVQLPTGERFWATLDQLTKL